MKNKLRIAVLILPVIVAIGYGCGKSNKPDMPDIPAGKYAGQWREERRGLDTALYHTDTAFQAEIQVIDEGVNIAFVANVANAQRFTFVKNRNMSYKESLHKSYTARFEYNNDTLYYTQENYALYGPSPSLERTFKGVRQ